MLCNVGVHLFSHKTVSTPGDIYGFHCLDTSPNALGVQWLVNGTLLENIRLENVFQHYNNMSKIADLSFNLPLEHNDTTVQCISSENASSEIVTLLLQGQLYHHTLCSTVIVDFYQYASSYYKFLHEWWLIFCRNTFCHWIFIC